MRGFALGSSAAGSDSRDRFAGVILGGIIVLYLCQCLSVVKEAPPASMDSTVFADAARTFLERGYLGTDHVFGMEHFVSWQPPLYPVLLACDFLAFGFGLIQMRLFTVTFGAVMILLTYLLARGIAGSSRPGLVAAVLLSVDPLFVKFARWERMDTLCAAFILASCLFLLMAIKKPGTLRWVGAGAAAALAMLTHPYGLVAYLILFASLLLAGRLNTRVALLLLAPGLCGAAFWAWYIAQSPADFLVQMKYQIGRRADFFASPLLQAVAQYALFPAFPLLAIAAVACMVKAGKRRLSSVPRFLLVSLLFTVVPLWLSPKTYNHVYYAPFVLIAFSVSVWEYRGIFGGRTRNAVLALCAAFVLNGMAYTGAYILLYRWNLGPEANHEILASRLLPLLPEKGTIGHRGYPTIFWSMRSLRPNLQLKELYLLDSSRAGEELSGLDLIVFTQCHDRTTDDQQTDKERQLYESILAREGRRLEFVGRVGSGESHAYRGIVYRVVHR